MRRIPIFGGQHAIVDDDDYDSLSTHKWYLSVDGYPRATLFIDGRRRNCGMSRLVMNPKGRQCVDHINHDKLDNRRANLRCCTHSENMANRRSEEHTSELQS